MSAIPQADLASLQKSVTDISALVTDKFKDVPNKNDVATRQDFDVLNKAVEKINHEIKVLGERSIQAEGHGLPFKGAFDFFYNIVKAQQGDGDAKKNIEDYEKKLPDVMTKLYKAPSANGFNTQSSAGEIFILPEYSQELFRTPASLSNPRNFGARQIPLSGNLYRIPALVDKNHSSSVVGGITCSRKPEGGLATASKAEFEHVELKPSKITALAYVTEEMLSDAGAFAALLPGLFVEAIDAQECSDFIYNGSGVGEPLGMLQASNPSLIAVTRNTASTVKVQDVTGMKARAYLRNWANYVWLASQDIIPQLLTMTNGNQTIYMSSAREGQSTDMILGRPVYYTDDAPALGTAKDLALVDATQYIIADNGGVQQQQSIHVRFLYGETTLRFIKRNDGQPLWRAALTPRGGGATRSPFIYLN